MTKGELVDCVSSLEIDNPDIKKIALTYIEVAYELGWQEGYNKCYSVGAMVIGD